MAHGGFVYLSISLSLSTLFWSFVVVYLICVSTLFSSLFCFDALDYAYGWLTLQMHPNVRLLSSPSCLNFTLFFWCFGICIILSTLQMHPMLYRSLGATRRSFWNFFWVICQRISRRDQQILIFLSLTVLFLVTFKTSNPFQFRWKDCQFGVWSVCVCVCVLMCGESLLGNRLQILNGLDTISVQCNLMFQIPPSPPHTHTFSLYKLSTPQVVLKYNRFKLTINLQVTNN
jgi:hypothetical protein